MIDLNATFFVQIFNFLILVALLKAFAYRPIANALKARSEKIAASLQSADDDQAAAAKLVQEYKEKLLNARVKAQEIVDAAAKRAEEDRLASVETTKHEIEQMKKAAEAQIQRDRDLAAQQLRTEMISLSLAAAGKLMACQMTSATDEKLVSDFISELDKDKIGDLPC